ncbi:MAG TPA: ABC transporter permease [Burkholderiaceae bacterium]|jgi:phospholipid/cholesterol/gamma-HCH transport system permease protein
MATLRNLQDSLGEIGRGGLRSSVGWSMGWWQLLHAGALVLVLAFSPSTYTRSGRAALARHVYLGTAPMLPWFGLLTALLSVVIIHIVVVTAVSYGLTQFALEMVVRVLVIELIPLTAALFVALRATVPAGAQLSAMHASGALHAQEKAGADPLRHELLPRVVAGMFAVLLLAAVSCLIAMVLAYVAVYGFTTAAFAGFTRVLGQIFQPGVALILALKTLFFSLVVALIPVAAFLGGPQSAVAPGARSSRELDSLLRLAAAVLVIEVLSLMGNYA